MYALIYCKLRSYNKDISMERLERKLIGGKPYYYYSKWGRKGGKCKRLWQKYLGKLEDIVAAMSEGIRASFAEVFDFGLPTAFWSEARRHGIIEELDRVCPKRDQGLTVGQYIAIAALNRAICPTSKMAMWEWFSGTTLRRFFPEANEKLLSSQRFWDHMDLVDAEKGKRFWEGLIGRVIETEKMNPAQICYDGTNFYTFISTFNSRCSVAKRGKNKQGRSNLRQVNYALFCSRDGGIPLYYDVYDGNTHDAKKFPEIIKDFSDFLSRAPGGGSKAFDIGGITVVFDKGNNSRDNIKLLDDLKLHFVGSVKLNEHPDLADVSINDPRFRACSGNGLEKMKAFSVSKQVYDATRKIVVTFNQKLFDDQFVTLTDDIRKAFEKLSSIQQRLDDRARGLIRGGRPPTASSIRKQCDEARKRQHLKEIISVNVEEGSIPKITYELNSKKMDEVTDKYLGKKLLITSREEWNDDELINAYHGQHVIEHVFRDMKGSCRDAKEGVWWPMNHWTDQKIAVHGLYCTIAVLLRSLVHWRVKSQGVDISRGRLMKELEGIREVINIQEAKGRRKEKRSTVLTKLSGLQRSILQALKIEKETVLG